ncbi:asparagine synthetase B family protein [Acinetobacter indicus]|uniref:asparagine synthetase B family protein n=1 Tax=Acinetobacter indicus TaxID=756892 RepID=UPI000CECACA9|nr:asparagine synthetase B family protein [Acinetobacter indicus]
MIFKVNLTKKDWLGTKKNSSLEKSILGFIHQEEIVESYTVDNLDKETFENDLKESLTGFFSLIIEGENKIYAAVDHIRSHPLFYLERNGYFYLSDNVEWLCQQVNNLKFDNLAKDEFQITGYVTGNSTLYKDVKQLQAGELLIFENGKLLIKSYYEFNHTEPEDYNEEKLKSELHIVASAAIARLVEYANGRQIVIPLSGGYDSRLIATLLKESNYPNIFTFTYGAKGNKEAVYSKVVADHLGLKWHFIEYTEELWSQAWNANERKEYQQYSSNYVSLPHIQDWLAVKILKEKNLIDENAVFVPGHTGDMVSGGHIPNFIHQDLNKIFTNKELVESLISKHYSLKDFNKLNISKNIYEKIVRENIVFKEFYSASEFANECEKWNWRNRQAKFICNSVRVYEFYGYDWWLPLWDKDFIHFFENLPLKLRNHTWYKNYVSDIFASKTNIINLTHSLERKWAVRKILDFVKRNDRVKGVVIKFYRLFFGKINNLSLKINNKDEMRLIKKGYSFNGILALYYIKDLEK